MWSSFLCILHNIIFKCTRVFFIYTIFKEVYMHTFSWNSHSTKWPSIAKLYIYTSKHYLQIPHDLKGCMDALNSSNTSLKFEIAHSLKIILFIINYESEHNMSQISNLIPSDRRWLNHVWAFAQNNKGPADRSKVQIAEGKAQAKKLVCWVAFQ